MTLAEFLAELRKTKGWRLYEGAIRLDTPRSGFSDCLVSALAAKKDPTVPPCDYELGGKVLGLRPNVAGRIADASDNPDEYPVLRARLLSACGLSEAR